MVGSGKTLGIILMIGAALMLVVFGAWATTALASSEVTGGGAALGMVLALVVIAPVFGIGAYLFRKGAVEQQELAQVQKEKQILNAVLTRGQVTINELVAEMQVPREDIERMVQDLVGKQLFSGAVNWDKGILYSVESQKLTGDSKCPNCGGDLTFAGKGLIVCPYCGSQVFLTKRAAEATAKSGAAPAANQAPAQPEPAGEPASQGVGQPAGARVDPTPDPTSGRPAG